MGKGGTANMRETKTLALRSAIDAIELDVGRAIH
jgi:hypothetical protein